MTSNFIDSLTTHIDTFLEKKIDSAKLIKYIQNNDSKVDSYIKALDQTVTYYNKNRANFGDSPYLINAIELNSIFNDPLPNFEEFLTRVVTNTKLSNETFSVLRDNLYFNEVWEIPFPKHLIVNILILMYRTALLLENKALLLDSMNIPKVQISSTLEEIICIRYIKDEDSLLYPAIKIWIDKWQEEGFSKKLFELMEKKVNTRLPLQS